MGSLRGRFVKERSAAPAAATAVVGRGAGIGAATAAGEAGRREGVRVGEGMRPTGVVGLRTVAAGVAEYLGDAGKFCSGDRIRVEADIKVCIDAAAVAAVVVVGRVVLRHWGTIGVFVILLGEEELDEAGLLGPLRAMGPGVLGRIDVVVAEAGAAGVPAAGQKDCLPNPWWSL